MIGTKPKSFGFDRSELESIGRVGFLVAATIGLGDRWSVAAVLRSPSPR